MCLASEDDGNETKSSNKHITPTNSAIKVSNVTLRCQSIRRRSVETIKNKADSMKNANQLTGLFSRFHYYEANNVYDAK